MSAEKIEKLVRMANQIGDYFRTLPDAEAVAGAADHLHRFWTPKMCREIVGFADAGGAGLNPIAARAVVALKAQTNAASVQK
jgi:formate dehydrogenase subunit delta